jgi:hypothetical protein
VRKDIYKKYFRLLKEEHEKNIETRKRKDGDSFEPDPKF